VIGSGAMLAMQLSRLLVPPENKLVWVKLVPSNE
jgi:hypothetical protein